MLLRGSFLLMFLSASLAATPHGQTSSPATQSIPTFKAKTRLVLVDVVVTNNRGETRTPAPLFRPPNRACNRACEHSGTVGEQEFPNARQPVPIQIPR